MISLPRSVAHQTPKSSLPIPRGLNGDRCGTPGASLFCSHGSTPQGYTPDRLPINSCVTVPDLIPLNPARTLFVKVTKSLFGRKKKSESGMPVVLRVQSGRGACYIHCGGVSVSTCEPWGECVLYRHLGVPICIALWEAGY